MSGVVFAFSGIEMVGIAAGEMQDPNREVPKAVNSVSFRIAALYCGLILLLVSILPTSDFTSGIGPFVIFFSRLGLSWIGTLIEVVLIIAALSSLNSGLYSNGRVLRSLGLSKQAPASTLRMSKQGVPWAGVVLTSVVYVPGAALNAIDPDAFETAFEAAALGVIFSWSTTFVCQLRRRSLVKRGVIPARPFQMPGSPWTSIVGLVFLGLVLVGLPSPVGSHPPTSGRRRTSWSSCSKSRSSWPFSPSCGHSSSRGWAPTQVTGSVRPGRMDDRPTHDRRTRLAARPSRSRVEIPTWDRASRCPGRSRSVGSVVARPARR